MNPSDCHERINDTKDFEEHPRRARASHATEEKYDSGCGRDEAKYPDEQEHDTEKNRGGFNHFLISC